MRNKRLHRRLVAIEAKSDTAANAIERERALIAGREISDEQAELAYKRFKERAANAPRRKEWDKLSVNELAALYVREVRR